MTAYTVTTDDRRVNDVTTGEILVGNFHLSELEAASWGVSWEPDSWTRRIWLDAEDEHPPDEELCASSEAWDVRPNFERFDPYVEDVRRLRRLLVGT
jgi:hypothetical protein